MGMARQIKISFIREFLCKYLIKNAYGKVKNSSSAPSTRIFLLQTIYTDLCPYHHCSQQKYQQDVRMFYEIDIKFCNCFENFPLMNQRNRTFIILSKLELPQMARKTTKVCLLLLLSLIIVKLHEIGASKFLFLDLTDKQVLSEFQNQIQKLGKLQSQSSSNIQISLYQSVVPAIISDRILSQREVMIIVNTVSKNQKLTLKLFENLSGHEQMKVFRHVDSPELKEKIIEAISNEIQLVDLFANPFFLKQKGKIQVLIKTLFALKSIQLNDILLQNIDLEYFISQRCVLSRLPFLQKLRDSKNYSLTRQQKSIIIPIILEQNSVWESLLKDEKPMPF